MRIVHLITHLRLGAGRAIVDLALQQARAGAEVVVAMADDAEGNWRSDVRLIRELTEGGARTGCIGDFFHRDTSRLRTSAARLHAAVGTWTSTVVHAHTAMGLAVARWAGAPVAIATCHGWGQDRPAAFELQDALAFTLADAIISPSRYWADRVTATVPGTDGSRMHVIPYGFDLSRYPRMERRAPNNSPRIVCVGELTHRKGQDVLIDAMPRVWARNADAELHLFGEGDLGAALRSRAQEIDPAAQRIIFRGHVADPYRELGAFDVFCLPTRSDNQPVAVIEAMLAGVPVVSTDVGGIPEMIADGAGEVVDPEMPEALADAIERVVTVDRTDAGAHVRRVACETYDVRLCASRTDDVYATHCWEVDRALR